MSESTIDRRHFARLFALGGSAAFLGLPGQVRAAPRADRQALRVALADPDWESIRAQFLMPPELTVLNAANLCPSPSAIIEDVHGSTVRLGRDPVPTFRDEMHGVKEPTRAALARFLRVAPEDVLITRNTSEGNNWVSSGLDLGPGDEVVVFSDNHPSNNLAWRAKAERHGFTVRTVDQIQPHPGPDAYLEAFAEAIGPRTRVLAFTHLTNTSGDLFPAKELCALAAERGAISLVDGAQSFGLLDVDLSDIDPDFYTGSAHKWPCGPMETGVLYVNPRVQERFWPSVYSAYTGRTGLSRTHEGIGQRDEPALRAFGRQIEFLEDIGQAAIEQRSRALADAILEGLAALPGVHLWTSKERADRAAVITFRPADLEPRAVLEALEGEGIVATARSGEDRPGIRFSPHFYNSMDDVERAVDAIARYVARGL